MLVTLGLQRVLMLVTLGLQRSRCSDFGPAVSFDELGPAISDDAVTWGVQEGHAWARVASKVGLQNKWGCARSCIGTSGITNGIHHALRALIACVTM
eukprot:1145911-Pelagomonas_calceolata.AAC.1